MKAIAKTKAGPGIEILDLEEPVAGENDILIKVLAGSLCGSDVHVFEWTAGYEWLPIPLVLGHEFSGKVVEIGERIRGVSVGDPNFSWNRNAAPSGSDRRNIDRPGFPARTITKPLLTGLLVLG